MYNETVDEYIGAEICASYLFDQPLQCISTGTEGCFQSIYRSRSIVGLMAHCIIDIYDHSLALRIC